MTTEVGRTLGLSRTPDVVMLPAAVSPMVWCGRRARLILPDALWNQLDRPGRRAVLCHELAHLRRRDHWVRWAELLVAAVYWWHPLVWWIRRRLGEEADLCCDAWVTWLMPQGRRAYAEALLQTRAHVSENALPIPTVGMAVTSGRARRFARRLTMLMTHSYRPRLSVSGVALAVGLAVAGWIATPAHSSEPPDQADSGEPTFVIGGPAPAYTLVAGDDRDLEARMRRLEQQMARLNELMEKFDQLMIVAEDEDEDAGGRRLGEARRRARPSRTSRLPRIPSLPRLPTVPTITIEADDPIVELDEDVITIPAPAPMPMPMPLTEVFIGQSSDEVVVRSYELPEGKLEALTELMVRNDVPVLVSPEEGCIEVHGTEAQQAIFAAFVRLIHPPAKEADERCQQYEQQTQKSIAKTFREQLRAQARAGRDAGKAVRKAQSKLRQAIAESAKKRARTAAEREELEEQAEALREQLEALEEHLEQAEQEQEQERKDSY